MAVASIYQIIYGLKQRKEAKEGLKKLGERDYMSAEDINQRAKGAAEGYTPAERLAFFQNLVRNNNAQYSRAMAYRPDMAGTILSGINYGNIGALNQYASNDAALRRQDEQRQANLIQQQDARHQATFLQKQQALGALGQAAQQNIIGGISNEESDIKDVFSMIYGGGMQGSGGKRQPAATTTANTGQNAYQGAPVANQPAYSGGSYTDYGSSFNGGYQSTYSPTYGGGQPYYGAPSNNQPAYQGYTDYTKNYYKY